MTPAVLDLHESHLARPERVAWIVGLLGIAGSAIGWILAPTLFGWGWLAAVAAWIGWPLGCMALLLIHALTGGRWGVALRPALLAGVWTLPLLLPAIGPLVVFRAAYWPWVHNAPNAFVGNDFYLNGAFFIGRVSFYVVVWLVLAVLIVLAARPSAGPRFLARVAPPGLILLAFTASFAAVDMTMSPQPHYHSSAWGMVECANFALLAMSVTALLAAPFITATEVLADVSKLLLAMLVLWGYVSFMQFLIEWNSDLPYQALWYVRRSTQGWNWAAYALGFAYFLLPFALLVSPRVQRSRRMLAGICVLLIAMSILRAWWLVLPYVPRGIRWTDFGPMLAMGGITGAVGLRAFRNVFIPWTRHG